MDAEQIELKDRLMNALGYSKEAAPSKSRSIKTKIPGPSLPYALWLEVHGLPNASNIIHLLNTRWHLESIDTTTPAYKKLQIGRAPLIHAGICEVENQWRIRITESFRQRVNARLAAAIPPPGWTMPEAEFWALRSKRQELMARCFKSYAKVRPPKAMSRLCQFLDARWGDREIKITGNLSRRHGVDILWAAKFLSREDWFLVKGDSIAITDKLREAVGERPIGRLHLVKSEKIFDRPKTVRNITEE